MALSTKHPLYGQFAPDWRVMNDTFQGERQVKMKGSEYLPATSGMLADGFPAATSTGFKAYDAYRTRAIFPPYVQEAVRTLVGIMHHKPPTIELPAALVPMREKATVQGESLEMLLRRINENQLSPGRYGMLLDLPSTPILGQVLPYIATYQATSMINWDNGRRDDPVVQSLNLVVLDETEDERQMDFEWKRKEKYRVLVLGDPEDNEGVGQGVYQAGVFRETNTFDPSQLTTPTLRGTTLDEIPFVFVNALDIVPTPDEPPLLNLARLCLAIYRGEADYRQSLFMQGQDTLVTIGDRVQEGKNSVADNSYRTGANASINLPLESDAKFIGVDSTGLSEQREALQNDRKEAAQMTGQLLDNRSRGIEAADALEMRVSARTATLNGVAQTGAFALQKLLRQAAVWIGADPEQVVVQENKEFANKEFEGKSLMELMQAKLLGAPISIETIHAIAQDRGLTEFELEEELALIEAEPPLAAASQNASPEQEGDGNSE